MTTVSVIVPVYNGASNLRSTVASVLDQRYCGVELIIVDDGSTDSSGALADALAEADPRIRVVHQGNRGVSAARNRGLDEAGGEWIVFLDADDQLVDPLLFDAVVRAGADDADIVCFGSSDDPALGAAPGSRAPESRLRASLSESSDVRLDQRTVARMIADESANAVWDKAYRRTVVDAGAVRFVEGIRMGEDLLFNLACIDRAEVVRTVPILGHWYRRESAGSATTRYLPDKFADLTEVGRRLEEWARSTGSAEIIAAVEFIRAKNVFSCMRDLHRADCEIPRAQRLAVAKEYRVQVPSVRVRGLGAGRRLLSSAYNLLGYRTMYRVTGLVGGLR
ncbi:glycosyltransferase family 2 protein [Brevibacterium casei]|uniref:Glycosyltransferase involved in cell wall bisynthesis n=2 Tax=Brevibacterium casei TaxID=33889 RepID=A0A2H1HNF7_9MICO|nr:glycosyltransferase family 2 protein [Brevibacterium casei]QPR38581.1 glycosyltransferase family 2 protein [Brevibacterium casei]QPR42747.1 glycosyltransferase family 2 protein [Brevibacterium casei]SMX64452.1 Glycosyltransferase involved in cell wall bisynthesis [Brevibacterium casei CIP 102111]VEW13364.1 Poly-beta-1,6-N-acetyl-D-glucosamine synthase [Brevibacterium casei]